MRVVIDIETDGLDATCIHVIVCKDIDTGAIHVFRDETFDEFKSFTNDVDLWVGHNIIAFDLYWIERLLDVVIPRDRVLDTLVLSQLLNQGREGGHSLEAWGERLGFFKIAFNDWSAYSIDMEMYCVRDVELNFKVYEHLMKIVERNKGKFDKAIEIEHDAAWTARDMHENGFKFDIDEARRMRSELEETLATLLQEIQTAFPPRSKLIREVTPRLTKHGTISRQGFKWYEGSDYTIFEEGSPFSLVEFVPFSPTSPQQVVERLWESGWSPTEKTKGHLEALKERPQDKEKLEWFAYYGWKVNEQNISTLPEDAPAATRLLVKYIMLAARVRTLTEWINCYDERTRRIHGRFNPLGTRTHRCSHSNPNMGNIATKKTIKYNSPELRNLAIHYGGRMRSLWICEDGAHLVGCDMESAHLRIFAHLINDKDFINALISGRKEDGTDPHSVNKRVLGDICVDRDRSKTFIFSFLNGAGSSKVSEIFACSGALAKEALDRFIRGYPGLARLKQEVIPRDAERGYFEGIDGRLVVNDSDHHMMGMYLQNMESVLMKWANKLWRDILARDYPQIRWRQVNWVHDEWVTEVYGSRDDADTVGRVQAESIAAVGELFKLRCPMGGEFKVGKNWLEVH